ncbi:MULTISPECIES: hypothetical protein [Pseudoalteromonas]|jgi:hypothetical protein|uniref:Uncharacterized protein n=1 Tax=Pseudoalteromonas lipolytica TaxID=570156 RepID=A0AAD0WC46_9GAMM|nr:MULTISPECIES: hypothetical protein [Pseudoalteromonas]AXV65063.1 hypothetical protein D0907_07220 [Pseudoalteromonas donghaensis]EWH07307.1 hypothetical protein AT00_06380 [Pseudoalteromonas lipolytica SCSIO 04301]MCC9659928.1 hypothetical protein [Pseudoalteromonas sp. MB41]QLJ09570.1 hypothetical protein GZH31_07115 [Pseudoalteromonas sp. JSTW]QMW15777.1 hypothetical protein H3302_06875 [Pseudoalteromonas sp. MT33b]|tara:strand:- start:1682 stop:1924 length:243 start_codon:yes stop_codon:yes gene_type:complete
MNKALLALILAPVLSVSASYAIANEAPEASPEMIKEFTEMCLNWAKDDDISNEELKPYVLKCVNDELEAEGFKKVKDVQI